jgi:hypothetical protein
MCDVIPGVTQEFRGALGSVNRPFAIPNDDGEEILIRLRPVCEPDSTGFADLPGGLAPEDDYFVTVLFEPPGAGARNAVVLGTAANRDRCETLASAAALPNGGSVTCASRPFAGLCSGGSNDGGLCTGDGDCPGGTCLAPPGSTDFSIRNECIGGPSADQACTDAAQCGEGGACLPFRLRFRFPDTDALVGTPDDDRTLTGPATIAVTPVNDPLPLGLATARCADTPGLVACIDELYAPDGTCETTPGHVDATFGYFTALPPANDYGALCETPDPVRAGLDSDLRFTVDAAGNVLAPMDYRAVLIVSDEIPIPRIVLGSTGAPAFSSGPPTPVAIPSDAFVRSFAPGGQQLPPLFTPVSNPDQPGVASFLGSVDAPVGVIRVQRRGCLGGAAEGSACTTDGQCGAGGTCATLFDFSDRLAGGVGPVVLADAEFELQTQNPVLFDGLVESDSVLAFVVPEALEGPLGTRLNADSDTTDPVLHLRSRGTGEVTPIGASGAEGRAITRVNEGAFRFAALSVAGDHVAFLELEPLEGDCADRAASTPGLVGSYVDQSLRTYAPQDDWRTSQTISGTRVEQVAFEQDSAWGVRASVGVTGGPSDADWDLFSVQWDGYVRILAPGTRLFTLSDDCSRMWIDLDANGSFDTTAPELLDNHWGSLQAFTRGDVSPPLDPGFYRIRIQYAEERFGAYAKLAGYPATVRFAYVVPSNRSAQPSAIANLEDHVLPLLYRWYCDQMDRNGVGRIAPNFERDANGAFVAHLVSVAVTDEVLRADLYGATLAAAAAAGLTIRDGEVWLMIPETHRMHLDGTIDGVSSLGTALGEHTFAPGAAITESAILELMNHSGLLDDRPYGGLSFPTIGAYPLVQGVSFAPWGGPTISSNVSNIIGALGHELTHGFGVVHDGRNEMPIGVAAHGNMMGTGFSHFRGAVFPERYPDRHMRATWGDARQLALSSYFQACSGSGVVASGGALTADDQPALAISTTGGVAAIDGRVEIEATASDPDGRRWRG